MSNRFSSNPPDEPVIGDPYPSRYDDGYDDQDWDDEEYGEYDEYDDEPYDDDGYYEEHAARQPLFYVVIGAAILISAAFAFLVFTLVTNGDDSEPNGSPTQAAVDARIRIDAPFSNDRAEIGKDLEVLVSANATEDIAEFELHIDDQVVDRVPGGTPDAEKVYHPRLRASFTTKGEHQLFVRLITASGARKDSDKVVIVALEPVVQQPQAVRGRVLTVSTIRSSPSDSGDSVGNTREGQDVVIAGRTQDNEWLYIESTPPGWVRRAAIEPLDALSQVPVRSASPTPGTATPATTASPTSVVSTQTPEPQNLSDMTPANAQLFDGGSGLRVSVANLATTGYSGGLTVAVSGLTTGTLTRQFSVNIPPGGAVTVDFELDPPVSSTQTAQIRVDPNNSIAETSEDNNTISVTLVPPTQAPEIIIATYASGGSGITVAVRNDGGPLANSAITVRVRVGNAEASQTLNSGMANGETLNFGPIAKPAQTGQATIEVLVDGGAVASTTIDLG